MAAWQANFFWDPHVRAIALLQPDQLGLVVLTDPFLFENLVLHFEKPIPSNSNSQKPVEKFCVGACWPIIARTIFSGGQT